MLGLFGWSHEMSPAALAWRAKQKEEKLTSAIDWDPAMPWQTPYVYKADSYEKWNPNLFPELSITTEHHPRAVYELGAEYRILSSDECWLACRKVLPRGSCLAVYKDNQGRVQTSLMFDGDVTITCLHWRTSAEHSWAGNPMMSFTPMEVRSLGMGSKFAKGHVVLGGLGLGYQLVEVSKRRQVKKITLIEKSESLANLIWPRVKPLIQNGHEIDLIVGDVFEVLPKLSADVALIDIFPDFGGNDYERDRLRKTSPNIQKIWCWGGGAAV